MASTKKHRKHAKLEKPGFGEYGRNELAFIGAPCGVIQKFANQVISALSDRWNIAYIDADHNSSDTSDAKPFAGQISFTDKIGYHRLDTLITPNHYERHALFNGQDIILINGNHFPGKAQIVFIHPDKKDSLKRKLDRLTNIEMVIKVDDTPIYDFISELITDQTPVHAIDDIGSVVSWMEAWMISGSNQINGLVLAGGKSQRLGQDKTTINYHGDAHRELLAKILRVRCQDTYLSCRADQMGQLESEFPLLPDAFAGLGPYGGILSAFRKHPNHAWFVIASDLPFALDDAVDYLLERRDPSKIATAYYNKETDFPDPLMTIWEPKAYQVLLRFLGQGYSCPRKVLINSDIAMIEPADPNWLTNVNTPEDLLKAKERIA
jgi:molybdopterin-guanine dinucleotide biosynthesis protein A